MTPLARLLAGLLLLGWGTTVSGQPLPRDPFTFTADQVSLQETGSDVVLRANGSIAFQQGARRVTASSATLRLVPQSAQPTQRRWTPAELTAEGRVTLTEPGNGNGSAGRASYVFSTDVLRLSGGVRWIQGGEVFSGQSAEVSRGGALVTATGQVEATLSAVKGLEQRSAAPVQVRAASATWDGTRQEIQATGAPVVLTQSGLRLEAPTLRWQTQGGALAALEAGEEITVTGDLEGNGQQATLTAKRATYDYATKKLLFTGPISLSRQGGTSRATSAEWRLEPPRQLRLYGLSVSASLEEPAPPPAQ